jgi:hypothetical protein
MKLIMVSIAALLIFDAIVSTRGLGADSTMSIVNIRSGQYNSTLTPVQNNSSEVTLTTSVISAKHIYEDNELSGISLKLRLEFKNNGSPTFLLYKNYDISHVWVSKVQPGISTNENEISSILMSVSSDLLTPRKLKSDDFAVLAKGESYITEDALTLLVSRSHSDIPGAISPGTHVLRIQTRIWPFNDAGTAMATELFKRHEKVWTNSITSEAMVFVVD